MQIGSISPILDKSLLADGVKSGEGAALPIPSGGPEAVGQTKSFGQFLKDALAEVVDKQQHAGEMIQRFAAGEPLDVHQVMIASQEAGLATDLTMQVRNKLVDAYQEIMRVNV